MQAPELGNDDPRARANNARLNEYMAQAVEEGLKKRMRQSSVQTGRERRHRGRSGVEPRQLRKWGNETTKQVLMLTDEDGNEVTLPFTTRKVVFDHDASNYGGVGEIANARLQKWCSRRRAARPDNQAGHRAALDAPTIETHLAKQARNLRKACSDDGISPQEQRRSLRAP